MKGGMEGKKDLKGEQRVTYCRTGKERRQSDVLLMVTALKGCRIETMAKKQTVLTFQSRGDFPPELFQTFRPDLPQLRHTFPVQ